MIITWNKNRVIQYNQQQWPVFTWTGVSAVTPFIMAPERTFAVDEELSRFDVDNEIRTFLVDEENSVIEV
jgi:hypothetical protein